VRLTSRVCFCTLAYSNVLQEFDGGPGQVALHGREGLPEPIRTASSHGCVRFENTAITWLAWHLEAGVPVIIG
jgi:lipoprotein-anchoring transpeptidase ErfK/SrfK